MRTSGTAGAGPSAAATVLRPADQSRAATARRSWRPLRLVASALRAFARMLTRRRQARRASLHGWTSMDPRVLADIGITRADVQAVLYAGVPIERLGARRPARAVGEVVAQTCRRSPRLRLIVTDDLDAAA